MTLNVLSLFIKQKPFCLQKIFIQNVKIVALIEKVFIEYSIE
jgi:hypothetical protein